MNAMLWEYRKRMANLGWGMISEISVKEVIKLSLEGEVEGIIQTQHDEKRGNVKERY